MALYIGNVKITGDANETKTISLTYGEYARLSAEGLLCADYYYMTTGDGEQNHEQQAQGQEGQA